LLRSLEELRSILNTEVDHTLIMALGRTSVRLRNETAALSSRVPGERDVEPLYQCTTETLLRLLTEENGTAVADTKGLFHAFRRMKKAFSLLFQALFGHEKLQNWSLWHGYSQKKNRRSKGSVELRYASVFLCASRMSPFSPSLPIRNGS